MISLAASSGGGKTVKREVSVVLEALVDLGLRCSTMTSSTGMAGASAPRRLVQAISEEVRAALQNQ